MKYSEIHYDGRHRKVGHYNELINAGLQKDINFLNLDGEYYVLGKMDTYYLTREDNERSTEHNGWTIMGVFEEEFLLKINGIRIRAQTRQSDDDNVYAQLFIESEESFERFIKMMKSNLLLNTKPEQMKIVFYKDKE